MTHGELARSIYRHGRSPRVCADDLNALSYYQTIFARTVSTCPITVLTSHHPQHGRSPRAQLILNLMPMLVHNIISIKGMMIHLNQSNIDILHNHLDYHNYTGVIKKTQSHKDFKSIIYQQMPICFCKFSNLQSTFYSNNFPFYNTSTRTNARHTIDTRLSSFALTPWSIFIFNL